VQLSLSPIAARRFFDVPMSELAGRTVSLRDLLPREERTLAEAIMAHKSAFIAIAYRDSN
jgi:hypothetical protein